MMNVSWTKSFLHIAVLVAMCGHPARAEVALTDPAELVNQVKARELVNRAQIYSYDAQIAVAEARKAAQNAYSSARAVAVLGNPVKSSEINALQAKVQIAADSTYAAASLVDSWAASSNKSFEAANFSEVEEAYTKATDALATATSAAKKAKQAAEKVFNAAVRAGANVSAIDDYGCNASNSGVAEFGGFSTTFAGDTALVSSELFKGFAPWTTNKGWGPYYIPIPRALGIRATASVPVATSTKADYADAAIQLRDGALVSATFSFLGSPYWYNKKCAESTKDRWVRPFHSDRVYFASNPLPELARIYFMNGLAIKGIKTGLEDDDDDSGSSLAGLGTLYVGFGFDGPVGLFREDGKGPTTAGTLDFQAGYQISRIGDSTLQTLYEDPAIGINQLESVFARLKLIVTDSFYLDIEHISPRGSSETVLGEVTTFKVGYSLSPTKN